MKTNADFELASFEVRDVRLGSTTVLRDGVLTIDADELRTRLLEDNEWFSDITVDIVHPGESARIVHVVDVVEPRVRVSEAGTDFPGMVGPPGTVGRGRTHRLHGVAVTEAAEPVPGEPIYWRESIVEMGGEGARYCPFSKLHNVVLTFTAKPERFAGQGSMENVITGAPEAVEYGKAVRVAGLKAAVYLAQTTVGQEPDHVSTYSLDRNGHNGLPRVAYLFQLTMPFIYGEIPPGGGIHAGPSSLPTMITPSEVLDGSMVNSFTAIASNGDTTYLLQNHPVIEELYRRHGTDLDFVGVVLYSFGDSVRTKERISSYAANLATFLRADGVVMNYIGGGHPIVDVMLTCQKLEQRGIKTTLLLPEMAVNPEDSGHVHYVREANAIVSTGNYEQIVDLPPVSKTLGGTAILQDDRPAAGALKVPLRYILGSTHVMGGTPLRGRGY